MPGRFAYFGSAMMDWVWVWIPSGRMEKMKNYVVLDRIPDIMKISNSDGDLLPQHRILEKITGLDWQLNCKNRKRLTGLLDVNYLFKFKCKRILYYTEAVSLVQSVFWSHKVCQEIEETRKQKADSRRDSILKFPNKKAKPTTNYTTLLHLFSFSNTSEIIDNNNFKWLTHYATTQHQHDYFYLLIVSPVIYLKES